VAELEDEVTLHKEIADAREFDFHEAEKRITLTGEALAFYADAETYHAIAFLPDHPCGEFIDDFSEDHGDEHYDRAMPGKRARACIRSLFLADEGKHPNAETQAAMQELEDGGGETFSSVDDLMKDLESDDLEGKQDV
jgi:hypothetical protein